MYGQTQCHIFCFLVMLLIEDGSLSCFVLPTSNTNVLKSTCGCKNIDFKRKRFGIAISGKRAYCDHTSNYRDVFAEYTLGDKVISIDLSNNEITEVTNDFFPSKNADKLKNVLELSFGKNKISYIGPEAFQYFESLKSLNLSHNLIGRISKDMFIGLGNLQKLFLRYNIFPIIPGDAFQHLSSLKKLDLTSDYLVCNYLMKDFVEWYRTKWTAQNRTRLVGSCKLPENNQGVLLRKLRPETLSDETSRLPFFEIQPSYNQVVFEGDSLPMNCEGTDLSASEVSWSLNGNHVESSTDLYKEDVIYHRNKTTLSSHIQLEAAPKWSGTWNCTIRSNYSHDFKHVNIMVLRTSTVYCDRNKVVNHFGVFDWPAAVNGAHVALRCQEPNNVLVYVSFCEGLKSINQPITMAYLNKVMRPHQINGKNRYTARRSCLDGGKWSIGDYSACQYADDVARLLDNVIHRNFSDNALTICRSASKNLKALNIREAIGLEKMCDFTQKCRQYSSTSYPGEMQKILIELVSKSLTSSSEAMMTSLLSNDACHTFNDAIEATAKELMYNRTSFVQTTPNVAIAGYSLHEHNGRLLCNVTSENFVGLNCTNKTYKSFDKLTHPGIFLPIMSARDFHQNHNVLLVVYRNGNLFQSRHSHTMNLEEYVTWNATRSANSSSPPGDTHEKSAVTSKDAIKKISDGRGEATRYVTVSDVYSVTLPGIAKRNLTKPMMLMFLTKERVIKWQSEHYIAMWNGTHWQRNRGECRFVSDSAAIIAQLNKNITVMECHVLGVFAILKNLEGRNNSNQPGGPMQSMHPSVYVGASVLCLCLLSVVVTYLLLNSLLISRDARHMVINICIHLLLDALAFTIGIWRVDDKVLCRCFGICLHYASLSVLFWIGLSARNISKEIVASQQPVSADPKPQRPILRFYLTGCGIPVIVCGITAAAKIQNYVGDENKYCWLSWETSLYAFYAPAALIAIGCLLVLLRILATLNCNNPGFKTHRHYRNTNVLGENTPLQGMGSSYRGSTILDGSSSTILHVHKEIDNEQSYRTRLRGVALTLVFFIVTWLLAALSVAAPQMQGVKSTSSALQQKQFLLDPASLEEQDAAVDLKAIFSYLFALFAIGTGVFMVLQHLSSRRDVLAGWRAALRCGKPQFASQVAGRHSNDIDLISNIKPKGAKRDNAPTPSVTEGMTLETVLPGTTGEETSQTNPASVRSRSDPQMKNSIPNRTFIVNSVCGERSCAVRSEPKNETEILLMSRSNSSYMKLPEGNRVFVRSNGSHHVVDPYVKHSHRHGNHHQYRHHHSRNGSVPIKITNLQHAQHESSMTEHSFDDSLINMHTMPVVLQHNQPKVDNGLLYKKYERIRKNLEAKRNRERKLTVLREYAQDPLTSNDEDKETSPPARNNERTPLLDNLDNDLCHNDDHIKDYLAINEYKKADLIEKLNGTNNEQPKYRTLLVSSPNRKKEDEDAKPRMNHIPPRRHRGSGNPNLASNYNKRKSSHRSDRTAAGFEKRNRDRPSTSKTRLAKQQPTVNSLPPSSGIVDKGGDANMSLHGIVEASTALPSPSVEIQKSHNYLTADSVMSNLFHVPSRKSSKTEATPEPHPPASSSNAKDISTAVDVGDGNGDSAARNETTV